MQRLKALEVSRIAVQTLEVWLTHDQRLEEVSTALTALAGRLRVGTSEAPSDLGNSDPTIIVRALYCFAVTTYVRCFNSGRRARIAFARIPRLTAGQRELHKSICSLRNRFFAHAVDDEEGSQIYIIPQQKGVTQAYLSVCHSVLASAGLAEIREFERLVSKVRAYVQREIQREGASIATRILGRSVSWHSSLESQ